MYLHEAAQSVAQGALIVPGLAKDGGDFTHH